MGLEGFFGRGGGTADGADALFHVGRLEDLEAAHEGFVDAHEGAGVVELAAVVGGAEDSHELAFGEELVPVLDDLQLVLELPTWWARQMRSISCFFKKAPTISFPKV